MGTWHEHLGDGDLTVPDHIRRLRAPDPRVRESAAREAAAVVRSPEEERHVASALAEAAVREHDPAALEAQLDALATVEAALDDMALLRLAGLRSESPVLGRLLARAARLQISGPVEPAGAGTLTVVRCLRGVPHTGLTLRTPQGQWVVLERMEFYGRAVNRLDPASTARVLLSGAGARALGEWDRLDADPRPREFVRLLRAADPRVRELAADEASDRPDSWEPEVGRYLCAALVRTVVREEDPAALEAGLHALLELSRFLEEPALAVLRGLDAGALPQHLRPYLRDLLEGGRTRPAAPRPPGT
ncbi:hypothetical protein ABZX75_15555 [Streptomyces sp. NPDC003038]|uniref:hypothetical protein n=1 Tax=unclassified Streptomyces TaxID=2593676 RepID=UPI0033AF0B52